MHKLKEILKIKGLSQSKVSRLADIPQSNFNLICNGKGYVPPAWRKRIAIVLNVDETDIFPTEREAN
ncbi:helix-turn-helix transcriptional regulator [Desulfosporosinus sp. SB140]|uniref:helix-turn-helix transcriptional regulator n=1 Tax=Desulfosporosinus paludis TaxID=3115649 RepID=UPI0038901077